MRRSLVVAALAAFAVSGSSLALAQSPPPATDPDFLKPDKVTRAPSSPAPLQPAPAPIIIAVPQFTG
jgi:hypothetical protein